MKITTKDGAVFEGTQAEYEAFLAFAEHKLAEQMTQDEQKAEETVDVYEKVEAQYVPQEGDYITVTGNRKIRGCGKHFAEIGEVLKVRRRGVQGDRVITNSGAIMDELYRKATSAEVEAYEKALADASKPKLKAGDFVKITSERLWYTPDKIYEVIVDQQGELVVIDDEGDENGVALCHGDFKLVDAYETKWAKIGRKVEEFKVGDIIGVNAEHKERLYTVTSIDGKRIYFDCDLYGQKTEFNYVQDVKLIAPVESTFK